MRKNFTTVVDFGTQKITVAVGQVVRGELSILGSGEAEYGGYLDGEFLEIEKLGESIQNAITLAEKNAGVEIDHIYVGVPSAFSTVMCKQVVQNYNKNIRISDSVIQSLYEDGNDFYKYSDYSLISSNAIEFVLDDGVARLDCVGLTTSKLKARVSYVLAENKFINLITEITNILGLSIDKFISCALAEYKYLLQKSRDVSVIIDCGHLSTSVAVYKGNAIENISEFSLGGGFVTSDLMRWLKLDYQSSDMLKRKVVLSIIPSDNDVYEVKCNSEIATVSAYNTNCIVANVIEKIGRTIEKCLQKSKSIIDDSTKFYLSGGGISYIKGAKEIIGRTIDHDLQIICPNIPQLARPHYSTVISLLNEACENTSKKGKFFKF